MSSWLPKKRRAAAHTTNAAKKSKKSKATRYAVDAADPFDATEDDFTAIIRGRALAWQRVGFGWNHTRYNPCKVAQKDFVDALKSAFQLHDKTVLNFGSAELELAIVFGIKPPIKSGNIVSPPLTLTTL
jgi:hypothetical protein